MNRALTTALIIAAFAPLSLAVSTTAAAEGAPGGDVVMRQLWRTQKADTVETVQRVYGRVVRLKLPRPFVLADRQEQRGFFIAEYVPDGETVDNWTRMITVTGTRGGGAAHVTDAQLAAKFEPPACPAKIFRDLGPTKSFAGVTGRMVVIGCGAPDQAGAEHGVIGVYRDTADSWTVQYAERNHGKPPFSPEQAVARLDALAPAVIPLSPATGAAK
ncbi:hypothetical protein KZX46_18335 [Polymorphobacter sp. PAMC 29334]|uniref:hypothetical protein n=1 Tax=Polymorphobacter sp. PAMC 29334 TaxID=2862331 RepID=UPI001C78A4BB|nr:hypothetical protein [Polymorphobacter sp. PAMC 29334]QYE34690.1 hypothetical protein KZX46_18335 [Polymorphobacter sp. PAMC 29334]